MLPIGKDMEKLSFGSEAQPFLDPANHIVYKAFAMDDFGDMGMKVAPKMQGDGSWYADIAPDSPEGALHKLNFLHEIGGLPTEIAGVTPRGEWIISQPEATHIPAEQFIAERDQAATLAGAVHLTESKLEHLWAVWHDGKPWLIGDLHSRNVMRDFAGTPRIMDALIAPLPARMMADVPSVQHAVMQAKAIADTATSLDLTKDIEKFKTEQP